LTGSNTGSEALSARLTLVALEAKGHPAAAASTIWSVGKVGKADVAPAKARITVERAARMKKSRTSSSKDGRDTVEV